MPLASLYASIAIGTLAVLMLAGALWQAYRVLGGISAVRMALMELSTQVEQVDERLTREVKQRAGQAGAAKLADERTILDQAQAHLVAVPPSAPAAGRPSRFSARR